MVANTMHQELLDSTVTVTGKEGWVRNGEREVKRHENYEEEHDGKGSPSQKLNQAASPTMDSPHGWPQLLLRYNDRCQ